MTSGEREVVVIGVGRMGLPICLRLLELGYAVSATDIQDASAVAVQEAGGQWFASGTARPLDAAVVITVLPGPQEVRTVTEPLLTQMRAGTTWIDMSTGTRTVGRERARIGAERGITILEAPMGGGPEQARTGQLLLFAGGSATDLERQRGLLDALAVRVLHVGSVGDGYTVKLLVNLLWFGQAVANAEALTLAVRAGLDAETFRHAVQASAAANRFMDGDASAFMVGDNETAFSLGRSRDELTAALELGAELDVPLLLADRVTDLYGQALERYGDVLGELLGARLVSDRAGVHFDPPESA